MKFCLEKGTGEKENLPDKGEPDRPFHNFRPLETDDQRVRTTRNVSIDEYRGSKMWKVRSGERKAENGKAKLDIEKERKMIFPAIDTLSFQKRNRNQV